MVGLAVELGRVPGAHVIVVAMAAAAVTIYLATSLRGPRSADSPVALPTQIAEVPAAPTYAVLMEALPDPMLTVSAREADDLADRRIQFANTAARDLLRIAGERALLVTAIRDPGVLEVADEALFGGVAAEATLEVGGVQPRTFRVFARPMVAAAEQGALALLVFREETELRRMERTRADFLANASHELRTPLASLAGFIETLRGHARDDPAARERFLAVMQAQTERMARLIDDLMSLSRIELGEHQPPTDHVDLAAATRDVVEALAPQARARGVRLEVTAPERGQAMITGDRDQIIQVVQNLVDNAIKYSPADAAVAISVERGFTVEVAGGGGPAARLSLLTPDHDPGAYAVLRVTDHGGGIARENLPRLTERFYRVEGQKSGERSGTGLGLAIVKHIINRHRGGLAVESGSDCGTTFRAYFPEAPPAAAETKLS